MNLHVAIEFLLVRKSKHVESVFSVEKLFVVINGVDLGLSLGDVDVVIDVAGDEALGTESSRADVVSIGLEQLVEDMVGPLNLLLLSDTGLLQQIGDNVTTVNKRDNITTVNLKMVLTRQAFQSW